MRDNATHDSAFSSRSTVNAPDVLRHDPRVDWTLWLLIGMSLGSVALFLILWEVGGRDLNQPAVLPTASRTIQALMENADSGLLLKHTRATLLRVFSGFVLGSIVGVVLGLFAGSVRLARLAVDPYINLLRFVPAIALLTPFVVWFGIGEQSKILLIAFATLFIVFLNAIAGVDDIPVNRVRAAEALGASPWQIFYLVTIPSALPYVFTGMRIAMGISFATIVVAEMIAGDTGIGYLLTYARTISAMDLELVAIVCLGILGWCSDKIFEAAKALIFRRFFLEA